MNIKAIHTDIKLLLHEPICNGYRIVHIGSVDFYEVQPLLTAQQRLYNKSF